MTKAQERTIDRIRRLVEQDTEDPCEIKRFEMSDYGTFISLSIETGLRNDEYSVAYLARQRAQLFVGVRGGVRIPVWNDKRKHLAYRAFHFNTILEAVVAQR